MWRVEARTPAGDYLETSEHWATPAGAQRQAKRLRDHYRAKGIETVTTVTDHGPMPTLHEMLFPEQANNSRLRSMAEDLGHLTRRTKLATNSARTRWECSCGIYGIADSGSHARDATLQHLRLAVQRHELHVERPRLS